MMTGKDPKEDVRSQLIHAGSVFGYSRLPTKVHVATAESELTQPNSVDVAPPVTVHGPDRMQGADSPLRLASTASQSHR